MKTDLIKPRPRRAYRVRNPLCLARESTPLHFRNRAALCFFPTPFFFDRTHVSLTELRVILNLYFSKCWPDRARQSGRHTTPERTRIVCASTIGICRLIFTPVDRAIKSSRFCVFEASRVNSHLLRDRNCAVSTSSLTYYFLRFVTREFYAVFVWRSCVLRAKISAVPRMASLSLNILWSYSLILDGTLSCSLTAWMFIVSRRHIAREGKSPLAKWFERFLLFLSFLLREAGGRR